MQHMLDIVGEIYEAACRPEHWGEVLRRLCEDVLDAKSAVIAVDDFQTGTRSFLGSWGSPKHFELAYRFGLARYDHAFKVQADQPPGVARQFIDHRTLRDAHPFYHSLMLKPNDVGFIAGMTLCRDEEWFVGLGVHRRMSAQPFDDEAMARIQLLYPHLKRAIRIHREFHRLRERERTLTSALSKLTLGVLVLSPEGKVLHRNPVVDAMLASHPGLMVVDDRLRAWLPEEQARLTELLARQSKADPRDVQTRPQAMGVHHPERALPLTLIITPIDDVPEEEFHADRDGCVAVYVSDPGASVDVQAESLQAIYGMSPAEACVAIGLVNGLSLRQIGEQNGVSVETVRSQLKSIFNRMGVHKQQDVIRVILSGGATTQA